MSVAEKNEAARLETAFAQSALQADGYRDMARLVHRGLGNVPATERVYAARSESMQLIQTLGKLADEYRRDARHYRALARGEARPTTEEEA